MIYYSRCTFFIIGLLGLILCFLWFISIRNYKKLNAAKFLIIHQLEDCLPKACFKEEWDLLNSYEKTKQIKNSKKKKQFAITKSEVLLPILLTLPFMLLLILGVIETIGI